MLVRHLSSSAADTPRQEHPAPAGLTIPLAERLVYLFGLALAGWVGAWGSFAPERVDWALPWILPPLHARFFGGMYLSGAVFLCGAFLATDWRAIRVAVPMTGTWTGVLLIASLFHLDQFDWRRGTVWVWFAAYALLPAFVAWVVWRRRAAAQHYPGQRLPKPMRAFLVIQGGSVLAVAVMLLLLPDVAIKVWPWSIPIWLARLYSAPFLAYAVGSLLAARRGTVIEARLFFQATLVFAASSLVASIQYRHLFSATSPATWVWFGGFGVAVCFLATGALLPKRAPAQPHRFT